MTDESAADTAVYVNGRFTAQLLSGVQRVAWQLLAALDEQVPGTGRRWELLCPPGARLPRYRHIRVRTVGPAGLNLHAWEQFVLPWAARDGLLLSLIGSAPWFGGPLACLIHDAAVFDFPQAYTPRFAAWYRLLFGRIGRRSSRLLTVSEFSRERLAHHLRLSAGAIAVVRNGADHLLPVQPKPDLLTRLGLSGRPFFLAVASANPAKNLARLEAAFLQVAARWPQVRLVIAGGGNPRVYARQGPEPDTVDARVLRIGPADDATLRALYAQALALVFPSLYEGFGLPLAEAMTCGCPVITSAQAPMTEVCGPAALYADPLDEVELAEAMQVLLTQPAEVERLRTAGLARAAGMTWQASAAQLLQALDMAPARYGAGVDHAGRSR